jgi:hypothetical protein
MRLILLLVVVLIAGLIVVRQLGESNSSKTEGATAVESTNAPQVPTNVRDVKQFDTQMNDFVMDNAAKRNREIEEATGQ